MRRAPKNRINFFLTIRMQLSCFGRAPAFLTRFVFFIVHPFGRRAVLVGARWSNGMSRRKVQADNNLLSAFASIIGGALGVGLPMAVVIIWACS